MEIHLSFFYLDEGNGLALSLIKCVVFGNLLLFSEPWFPHLYIGHTLLSMPQPSGFLSEMKMTQRVCKNCKLQRAAWI